MTVGTTDYMRSQIIQLPAAEQILLNGMFLVDTQDRKQQHVPSAAVEQRKTYGIRTHLRRNERQGGFKGAEGQGTDGESGEARN